MKKAAKTAPEPPTANVVETKHESEFRIVSAAEVPPSPNDRKQFSELALTELAARPGVRAMDANKPLGHLRALIADDSFAASFQTLRQYRCELLREEARFANDDAQRIDMSILQSKILALMPQHEYNYNWPSDKDGYRNGFAEGKKAAAALVKAEEN